MRHAGVLVIAGAIALGACGDNGGDDGSETCGNGVVDGVEECDDGEQNGTAGCTGTCRFACDDPAIDCAQAPLCQLARCTAEHTCEVAPDPAQDFMSCGTDAVCNTGVCVPLSCGNGVVEGSEQCDFGVGNGINSGCEFDCTFSCTGTSCDDALACNGVETCDPVTVGDSTGYRCVAGTPQANGTPCGTDQICVDAACVAGTCGDGFITGSEECDDADATPGDGCETDCRFTCLATDPSRDCTPADACQGQGTCRANHTCAPGTPLPDDTPCGVGGYCSSGTCTQPVCGNGVVEPGEVCDEGSANGTPGSGCRTNCTWVCVNPSADCGTPPVCQEWTCTTSHTCQAVADPSQNGMTCGTGQVCTDGSCAAPTAVCGNNIVETGEDCDFGSGNGPGTGCEDSCTFSCTITPNSCTDGDPCNGLETCTMIVVGGDTGQRCTAGTPQPDGTSCGGGSICLGQDCVPSTCGDGYIDAGQGETCEPPGTGTCDAACHVIACGDGVRAGGEQCDDGNTTRLDGCDNACKFEQSHRMNSIAISFGTEAGFCPANALGTAIVGTMPQDQITDAFNQGVADGSITINFHALGLDDLSGTSDPALEMGVLGGTPTTGSTPYDGANDLDWWYTTDPTTIDSQRRPTQRLAGAIAARILDIGPAPMTFTANFAGVVVTMEMLATRLRSTIGAPPTTPLVSTGTAPGHLASEHLDPALTSYATAANGKACGNTLARSLANAAIPSVVIGVCNEGYTSAHSLLDLYIGGCRVLIFTQIRATQPDAARNPGDVYRFQANAQRYVTSCTKNGAAAPLQECLDNAAFTTYYTFTTDRVIAK